MPFQVTFSQKAIPSGIIQFLDAGDDGNAICDTGWTLDATIVGDLAGHTVLWEQIQGTPVTYTTPVDQVTVSYTQTTFENKKFRFWLDKGTSSQRFDDVTVFGSPTTSVAKSYAASANHVVFNTTSSTLGEKLTVRVIPSLPTTKHDGFAVIRVYSAADLLWATPITDTTLVGYVIRERPSGAGNWVDVATLPPIATEYSGAIIGNVYQVSAVYTYSNSKTFSVPSNVVSISGILEDTDGFIVDAPTYVLSTGGATVTAFDIETLSISGKTETDIIKNGFSTTRSKLVAFDVDVLSITNKTIPFDSTQDNAFSVSSNNIIISAFDITVMTGGQVGGS